MLWKKDVKQCDVINYKLPNEHTNPLSVTGIRLNLKIAFAGLVKIVVQYYAYQAH